jgi:hypothetical protein
MKIGDWITFGIVTGYVWMTGRPATAPQDTHFGGGGGTTAIQTPV